MNFSQQLFSNQAFFEFIDSSSNSEIPLHLSLRNHDTLWFSLIGVSISFVLLAISRIGSSNVVAIFSKALYKNKNIEKIVKEDYSLNSFRSIILVLNFIITCSILLYLSYLHFNVNNNFTLMYFLPIVPVYFFLWPLLCYSLIGFLTKEKKIVVENKHNVILISQIIGLLFSILLLLWAFNIKWSEYFILAFIIIMVSFWIYKIFRGIIFSFQHGVAWYYIILYFCTLEILPLVLIYNIYLSKMSDFWLFV